MDRVGVRELRQNASRYLAIVAAGGGPIVITDRGRPEARLVGIGADPWTDLIDSGEVAPSPSHADILDIEPLTSTHDASAALDELRHDER